MAAIVLVVLVLFGNGSTYTLKANFLDAGGLVTGDDVLIGPAKIGSVKSIGLTPNGQAEVVMGLGAVFESSNATGVNAPLTGGSGTQADNSANAADPPGLSLEGFDAVGRRRTLDDSYEPIDLSGVLPDGTRYTGVTGLRQALLARSDLFVTALTEKLLTYALGRGVEYGDAPAVRAVIRRAASEGYRLPSLIVALAESTPFQMRRTASDDRH